MGLLAIATAAAVVAVRYVKNLRANRAVHRMREQARHDRQLELEQLARREAQKCTYVSEMCSKLNSLVHEATASMRGGVEALETGEPYAPTCAIESGAPGCQSHVELIEQLLFEQRSLLPPTVFAVVHEIRTASVAFEATARGLSEDLAASAHRREVGRLRAQYEHADGLYTALVDEVGGFLGECAVSP